jgi:hypothetical protein
MQKPVMVLGALLLGAFFQVAVSGRALAAIEVGIINDRGVWSSTDFYAVGDAVTYNGSAFVSQTRNAGRPPASNAADWAIMDSANAQGSSETKGSIGTSPGRVRYAGPSLRVEIHFG